MSNYMVVRIKRKVIETIREEKVHPRQSDSEIIKGLCEKAGIVFPMETEQVLEEEPHNSEETPSIPTSAEPSEIAS